MAPILIKGTANDPFFRVDLVDDSVVNPTGSVISTGFSFLQPFFGGEGRDNVILGYTDTSIFESDFGTDLTSVKKYGHGGLIASEVIRAGGRADVCRLMPDDAARATAILAVKVSGEKQIPQYKRDASGRLVKDADGKLIPLVDKDGVAIAKTGVEISVITQKYDVSKSETVNMGVNTVTKTTNVGGVDVTETATVYPLFALICKGRGSYGNNIGFKLGLNGDRDGKNEDGRRYTLDVYKTVKNAVTKLGTRYDVLSFSFDPEAVAIPGTDIVDSFDVKFNTYADKYNLPLYAKYSGENYLDLIEELGKYDDGVDSLIDVITGTDLKGSGYDRIALGTDTLNVSKNITCLKDGTDGSLDPVWVKANVKTVKEDKTEVEKTDAEVITHIAGVKEQLLISFYKGQIDPYLFDDCIIDCGITLDAGWSDSVKAVMSGYFHTKVRQDVFVYLDTGLEVDTLANAVAKAVAISAKVSSPWGNTAINIHNGTVKNRNKQVRTTGNYEVASALTRIYKQFNPFVVHAGYECGGVENMKFDFAPMVVEDDLQIAPLMEKRVLWAMQFFRDGKQYFMSDDSQYSVNHSVLGSCRNLIFAGDVARTIHKVTRKYGFHPEEAEGAMRLATIELNQVLSSAWFNKKIKVSFKMFQTSDDAITDNISIEVEIKFPGVAKTWSTTIHAKRQEPTA